MSLFAATLMLLAAQDPGGTAIDAERAFAADAQSLGQWTAFRRWSTGDAVMFVPEVVNAHIWLNGRADPPASVSWWPTASYVSCDGNAAVNTGGWTRPDGSTGYFSTVWLRQPDGGWKWALDHGDRLEAPRPVPERPSVQHASCDHLPEGGDGIVRAGPRVTIDGEGLSPDRSLLWEWHVMRDGRRTFMAHLWTGDRYEPVLLDDVAAPQ